MPLPPPVLRQFTKVPANPSAADFSGAYNKLLAALFPPDSRYTVVPRWHWPTSLSTSTGSSHAHAVPRLEVALDAPGRVVLVLELGAPSDLGLVSAREAADLRVRLRPRDAAGPWRPLRLV